MILRVPVFAAILARLACHWHGSPKVAGVHVKHLRENRVRIEGTDGKLAVRIEYDPIKQSELSTGKKEVPADLMGSINVPLSTWERATDILLKDPKGMTFTYMDSDAFGIELSTSPSGEVTAFIGPDDVKIRCKVTNDVEYPSKIIDNYLAKDLENDPAYSSICLNVVLLKQMLDVLGEAFEERMHEGVPVRFYIPKGIPKGDSKVTKDCVLPVVWEIPKNMKDFGDVSQIVQGLINPMAVVGYGPRDAREPGDESTESSSKPVKPCHRYMPSEIAQDPEDDGALACQCGLKLSEHFIILQGDKFQFTGQQCSDCTEPQFMTPSGVCCINGHGGAAPLSESIQAVKGLDVQESDTVAKDQPETEAGVPAFEETSRTRKRKRSG